MIDWIKVITVNRSFAMSQWGAGRGSILVLWLGPSVLGLCVSPGFLSSLSQQVWKDGWRAGPVCVLLPPSRSLGGTWSLAVCCLQTGETLRCPARLGSGAIVSPEVTPYEEVQDAVAHSKIFSSSCQKSRECFSCAPCENVVELLEVELKNLWGLPGVGAPEFLTLRLVHTEPPAIC